VPLSVSVRATHIGSPTSPLAHPESPYFQKDRDTIEKRSGRWLKDLARQSPNPGFNLNAWIPAWEAGGTGRLIPGRN
jgi:hypothetical protein